MNAKGITVVRMVWIAIKSGLHRLAVSWSCPGCCCGTIYQFTTKGFDLLLDAILDYQIRRQPRVSEPLAAVKVSIFFLCILNRIPLIITFQNRSLHEVGCGLYLLATSIDVIFKKCILIHKFLFFLLLSQMIVTAHSTSLKMHCYSLDFLLRLFPAAGVWLTTAVAIERVLVVTKEVNLIRIRGGDLCHGSLYSSSYSQFSPFFRILFIGNWPTTFKKNEHRNL